MVKDLKHWKTDIPAGIVVFLVAVPLCLGIASASGAPALSGVIAGIVGGIVVTLFSNSSLGVSGPAAGLITIVAPAIKYLGFQNFLIAVALAGVFQFALGCFRAGTIGYYFPTAVIKGMLVAIGLVIVFKQIPHAIGYDRDYEGDLTFRQADGYNTFTEIGHALSLITPAAVVTSIVCLAILIFWETKFMKSFRFTTIIQGPLVAVIAGVLLYHAFNRTASLKLDEDHLVSLPATIEITTPWFDPAAVGLQQSQPDKTSDHPKSAADDSEAKSVSLAKPEPETAPENNDPANASSDGVSQSLDKPVSGFGLIGSIIFTALTLAVVASLESLLCAEATDKLDPQRRQTDLNRELRAQGLGNFIAGMLGGLPVTQVIVRSSTNIQSGAQSRLAAFVHGIFLVACVVTIPNILNMIPFASLAAILFVVGYKLAHPSKFRAMYKLGWTQFLPFTITITAILCTNLLGGIGIGLVASLFFILKDSYVRSHWMIESEDNGQKIYRMTLAECVFFINKGSIQASLQEIEPCSRLIVDATDTLHIDQDVIDLFNDFETHATFSEIEFVRVGLGKDAKREHDPARITRQQSAAAES